MAYLSGPDFFKTQNIHPVQPVSPEGKVAESSNSVEIFPIPHITNSIIYRQKGQGHIISK